jgi:hypothetical protein
MTDAGYDAAFEEEKARFFARFNRRPSAIERLRAYTWRFDPVITAISVGLTLAIGGWLVVAMRIAE